MSGVFVLGRGARARSTTRLQSSVRSTKKSQSSHHDALEFPDGTIVLLTFLEKGQQATVLQLPVTHEGASVRDPGGRIPNSNSSTSDSISFFARA
jgi:hypothetical protein